MSQHPNLNLRKLSYPRSRKGDLSFAGRKLKVGIHRIHPYPAMLHPMVIQTVLDEYARDQDVVFDPFCGSGSVLVGAQKNGHSAVGFDINPLALLIAQTKTCAYDIKHLSDEIQNLYDLIRRSRKSDVPDIPNIEFWYDKDIIKQLGRIRYVLLNKNFTYSNLYVVCFAYLCRQLSYTNKQEFKRVREQEPKRDRSGVDAVSLYFRTLKSHISVVSTIDIGMPECQIRLVNSENPFPPNLKYDFVITSPPYGDHDTTVAYGQYSSFGNEWTKKLNPFNSISYRVDREGLGRCSKSQLDVDAFPRLKRIIDKISKIRSDRAKIVFQYFGGYYNVINNVIKGLNVGGCVCFVVGNRRVAGIEIQFDQITAEMLESLGLRFVGLRTRKISNKVMPQYNSPSNVVGRRSSTMSREYVVVFRKE